MRDPIDDVCAFGSIFDWITPVAAILTMLLKGGGLDMIVVVLLLGTLAGLTGYLWWGGGVTDKLKSCSNTIMEYRAGGCTCIGVIWIQVRAP